MPPVSVLGWFVLARLLCRLPVLAKKGFPPSGVARISWIAGGLGIIVLVAQLTLFGLISWQMKIQQRVIEDGNRAEVGRWLKNRVGPHERVFLESIGYIGYFSGARIADYPGLLSPEVVSLRRQRRLAEFRPEWLVLRPRELRNLLDPAVADSFRREYREEHVFDVTPTVASFRFLPGRSWLEYDACYHVFKRIVP
jgi:hypothetical protein